MRGLEDTARPLERHPFERRAVGQPSEARVLVADADVPRLRLDEEEPDVLLDEDVAPAEPVVGVVLEAGQQPLRRDRDRRLLLDLALRRLDVRLPRLHVALREAPVPAAIAQQQVLGPSGRGAEDDGARGALLHALPRRRHGMSDHREHARRSHRAACAAWSASSTRAPWPALRILRWSTAMRPAGSTTTVVRITPTTLRPYIVFSPCAPYRVATLFPSSDRSANGNLSF